MTTTKQHPVLGLLLGCAIIGGLVWYVSWRLTPDETELPQKTDDGAPIEPTPCVIYSPGNRHVRVLGHRTQREFTEFRRAAITKDEFAQQKLAATAVPIEPNTRCTALNRDGTFGQALIRLESGAYSGTRLYVEGATVHPPGN